MTNDPDPVEALRLSVIQRNILEDRLSTAAVRLKAAEASRDVAVGLVQRCQQSFALLEVDLRYLRDRTKEIVDGYKIVVEDLPPHLETQRVVCQRWAKALKDWLANKDAPRKK